MLKTVNKTRLAAAAAALIAMPVGFLAVSAAASGGDDHADQTDLPRTGTLTPRGPAVGDFPQNASGQTYGSDVNATSLSEAPALVAVVGDHGIEGYVRAPDLYMPPPKSPEEALARQSGRSDRVVDVFDVEGVKIVDTYTLRAGVQIDKLHGSAIDNPR